MKPNLSPSIIIIFGITGDLAKKKLLPALYHLLKDELLHPDTVIIGVSRRQVTENELLSGVELCINEVDNICDPAGIAKLHHSLRMHTMDLDKSADYSDLLGILQDIEDTQGSCMNRLYYLSIPPQTFETVVSGLGANGHNKSCDHGTAASRLLIEKPFGYDLESAKSLIELLNNSFADDQIYRIDHYVAKETVQNILAFRMHNPIFSTIWNHDHIQSITISAYESIDIQNRATFYEGLGALRDFVQNHLLQLAAIVTMDLPKEITSREIHSKKLQLLQAVHRIKPDEIPDVAKRGQYTGYSNEVGNQSSITETYASIELDINNDTWSGVPIILNSGKALSEKRTDIHIVFAEPGSDETNELVFLLQPNEGIALHLKAKEPGYTDIEDSVIMEFDYARKYINSHGHPDAYERVIVDAARGDPTLFSSSAETLAAWEIVNEVVLAWSTDDKGLVKYPKGAKANEVV